MQPTLTLRFSLHQCLHWMITGFIYPVLILIFQSRGLDLSDVGLVMAVWIGCTSLLEIPLGGIADKYGRRKTYLASLVINALGCSVLYVSQDFLAVLFAAAILGASRAVYSGTLDAWFYERFHSQKNESSYHSALAKVNMMATLGLAIGSLIGGWLPDIANAMSTHVTNTLTQDLQHAALYELNISFAIVANLVLIALTFVLIKEESTAEKHHEEQSKEHILTTSLRTIQTAMQHHTLKRLMQTTLVFGLTLSAVENHWQPFLAEITQHTSYGVTVFGVISACYFLMASASSLFSVPLLRLLAGSHKHLLLVTRIAAGITLIALAHAASLTAFAIGYLTFFFLFTVGSNSKSVLLNDNTEEKVRSTMLSIRSFVVTCGGVISSLLFGFVSEHYGISMSWMIGGVMLVLSSLLFVLIPENLETKTASLEQK